MNATTRPELLQLAREMHPRMETARRERMARQHALSRSRELVRQVGVRECHEFLAALQNIQASTKARPNSILEEWNERLLELCTDFDAELNEEPPEVPEFGSERAELDAWAPRSNR